jgi:hypothetical protein
VVVCLAVLGLELRASLLGRHLSHAPSPFCVDYFLIYLFIYLFAVLGLELRAYTLSHSTSPFL